MASRTRARPTRCGQRGPLGGPALPLSPGVTPTIPVDPPGARTRTWTSGARRARPRTNSCGGRARNDRRNALHITAGAYVPQWIGIASRGRSSASASAARSGSRWPAPERRPPAPDRQQRHVEARREVGHLREEVGVAGEVDAAAIPRPRSRAPRRAGEPGPRRPSCSAWHRPHLERADVDRSPGRHLDHLRGPVRGRAGAAEPAGASTSRPRATRRSDGQVRVVAVQVREQDRVEVRRVRGPGHDPAQVRDAGARGAGR